MLSTFVMYRLPNVRPRVNETVRQQLKRLYGAHKTLGYNEGRKLSYNNVECANNEMTLIYVSTPYPWTCGSNKMPSSTDVNAEHIVPQSTFDKKEPMKSDIHHLFASPSKINNMRGNLPYGELDRNTCKYWCNKNQCQNSKPSNPAEYDCISATNFMPIDQDKGRVARAIFYFYTVYDQYDISSKFDVALLKKCNSNNPPQEFEIARNDRANKTQGNRNPYIDDFTLVDKAF